MPAPSRAQIKINALQRLVKEHQLYVKELEQFQSCLAADQGGDGYETRKVNELAAETRRVLLSLEGRIKTEISQVKELANDEEVGSKVPQAAASAEAYLATL